MVPVQMELGGKDACIVFPDADLDLAATAIVKGGFSYSGQRCTAVKIVVAFEEIADALVAKVEEKTRKLTVGQPEDDAQITAVVSAKSADFIQGLVEDAVAKGATMRAGGGETRIHLAVPRRRRHGGDATVLGGTLRPGGARRAWGPRRRRCGTSTRASDDLQGAFHPRHRPRLGMRIGETGTVQINGPPARGPDHFPFRASRTAGSGVKGSSTRSR